LRNKKKNFSSNVRKLQHEFIYQRIAHVFCPQNSLANDA
jgi:hypothetical protein